MTRKTAQKGDIGIREGLSVWTRSGIQKGPCFVSQELFMGAQIQGLLKNGSAIVAEGGETLESLKRAPVMRARSQANAYPREELEFLTLSKLNELAAKQSEARPTVYTSREDAIKGLSLNAEEGEADEFFKIQEQ